jgi:small subunit ribosomal protein S5
MTRRPPRRSRPHQKEPKEFDEQVIQIDRVTKVVKGGRRLSFRATVVIGNRRGKVGIGLGKSNEVTGAIQKAIAKAKKYMITVPLDGSTIPHDIKIKYKSAKLIFLPAAPGTGIIAGGTARKILELAGIKDVLSKRFGTTNKVNNTKAVFEALKRLRITPAMAKRKATPKKEEAKEAPNPAAKEAPNSETKNPATKEAPNSETKNPATKEAPKSLNTPKPVQPSIKPTPNAATETKK